jgi:peptidoglycan/LPS O-acetylase OafA/YrhL
MAALAVVLSHVRQDVLSKSTFVLARNTSYSGLVPKQIFRAEGYGHAAVVVFFVLSGFLVGGKLIALAKGNDIRTQWRGFLVDRIARIFTVLWPAIALTAVVFLGLKTFAPTAPFFFDGNWAADLIFPVSSDGTFARWLAALTLFNELAAHTLISNGPLWSLSYEWSYYMIGLAAVLLARRIFSVGSLLVIGYAALLVALSLHNQFDVLFSGLSWGAGALSRIIFDKGYLTRPATQLAGIAAVGAVLIIYTHLPIPDVLLGLAIGFMIAHRNWTTLSWGGRFAEWAASFSYSLYLIHFPIMLGIMGMMYKMGIMSQPLRPGISGLIIAGAVVVVLILTARGFAWLTEDRTRQVKNAILNLTGPRRSLKAEAIVD